MESIFDVIVAPITAEGGAVAVVRLSGTGSWCIASSVFQPWPSEVEPRRARYGRFSTGDDGLVLPFEEGQSYTGEECAELSVHGSRASVRALVEACLDEGARMARPGEFTERAFLNGRLDLTQAEGVRDTVEAQTGAQLRQANFMREGRLRTEVNTVRELGIQVLAAVEASVDFSEEIGDLDRVAACSKLNEASERLANLLKTSGAGRILRQGLRIAIVGPPNAGKSSLMNRLLGYDRSIVTEIPGTTRDFVEERIDLGGIPCVLTDTAGLRPSEDAVEKLGIERSGQVAQAADEIWYLFDGTCGWTEDDERTVKSFERPVQVLQNKVDLNPAFVRDTCMAISAWTGEGLDRLIALVSKRLEIIPADEVWINERHEHLFRKANEHLEQARATLAQDLPVDLASVHLQAALQDLGQVTGETASADILDTIFGTFCIGK